MNADRVLHAGLDVGSTTVKLVVVDPTDGTILFSDYRRHHADIGGTLRASLAEAAEVFGLETRLELVVTGSAGMGLSESCRIPFLQEVIAAASMVGFYHPDIRTLVDIGGEDAKMIFFDPGRSPDIRMNGSCAGGTGSFIDQIATLLNCDVTQLNALADSSTNIHPIASRCGVFAKTDIQNLLSRNISPADIASSSFHAVAQQMVTTLARGRDLLPKVLFCGGPLAFIPALKRACMDVMGLKEEECVLPANAELVPALGCAVAQGQVRRGLTITAMLELLDQKREAGSMAPVRSGLPALFASDDEYREWKAARERHDIPSVELGAWEGDSCHLGIDSGSTTTKIVALDKAGRLVFSHYAQNNGNPLETVREGLERFHREAVQAGKGSVRILSTAVTGYGEDLIKAAFNFETGLVETIAHYRAAKDLSPDVSFILDIGGQDMKATFIEHGTIVRLDINEACSSGCGSFIDGFARSLKQTASGFSERACQSQHPCDLGTRCTVFMNSKVKQSLRENAPLEDIAAGLAYSVARNCLYKVLKLKSVDELGSHIVVQGGTMRNHAVVRAFELLTGRDVIVAPMPELMGAYGSALHALESFGDSTAGGRALAELVRPLQNDTEEHHCPGCTNHCLVRKHTFANGNTFFAGNKCEKIYTNRGTEAISGDNLYDFKYRHLFGRCKAKAPSGRPRIGIPRALNYYENLPFWHALLDACGMDTVLSATSTFKLYGKGVGSIMSDNICFPAKLVHGHIHDLVGKKVDRILMPFAVYEQKEDERTANSYNCPIVTGYSDVIRSAMDPQGKYGIPLDSPTVTFHDTVLLKKACRQYMAGTYGVSAKAFSRAFERAMEAQQSFQTGLSQKARDISEANASAARPLIMLVGRPYHADPLIQHKVADIIADFGADVVSEDLVRGLELDSTDGTVRQWAYPNRILKAAEWVAQAPGHVHLVQLTSFGCGPDAFILDAVGEVLRKAGKSHTVLKVDDVNNPGSLRLRIRSLIESLAYREGAQATRRKAETERPVRTFGMEDVSRKILFPFFSDAHSPFFPVLFRMMGYDTENLPKSDGTSIEYGLQYANNDICYPATLVIGDIVRAFKSGRYDPDKVAIAITQTGGQCRASNYLSLIRKAMAANNLEHIPVVAIGTELNSIADDQPGFKLRWKGHIRTIIKTILYADRIARMYDATAPRERTPGAAAGLRDDYIAAAIACLERGKASGLYGLLARAAEDFNAVADHERVVPRIGVVGEIYVKYNSVGNKNIVEWLIAQGVEPVVPSLADFFLQVFPNRRFDRHHNLAYRSFSDWLDKPVYWAFRQFQAKFDKAASAFRYASPAENIFDKSESAERIISLGAQYGEGWLIPAELSGFAEQGIHHAISLQPFGCIANHLVAKGIERRVCDLYPKMSLLFLDLDSGASEANIFNRLHFMIQGARKEAEQAAVVADSV